MRSQVVLAVAGLLVAAGCSSTPSPAGPPSTAPTTAAATTTRPAAERAMALAAVPAALTSVTAAQRQAACSSYTSGKDAFLSAFSTRFDAQYSPITPDELATVRSTLDQVCG